MKETILEYLKALAYCIVGCWLIWTWGRLYFFGSFHWFERVMASFAMAFGCLIGLCQFGGGEFDHPLDRVLVAIGVLAPGAILSLVSFGATHAVKALCLEMMKA